MTPDNHAWIAHQWLCGLTQKAIARTYGASTVSACNAIIQLCRAYGEAARQPDQRARVTRALARHLESGGLLIPPPPPPPHLPPPEPPLYDPTYAAARREHAARLRAAGLTYRAIAARLGVTTPRAQQLVRAAARQVSPTPDPPPLPAAPI
jgi:hypothetical protein